MKKLFVSSIMTAVLLPGWVNAESPDLVTLLSLTKPQNSVLSSGNSSLTWSEETTGTSLDNFAISFQLTETRNTSSPQNIFSTSRTNGGASGNALQLTSSSADGGYTCLFSYAGQSFDMTATTERGSLLLTLIMRKSKNGSSASATLYSGTQTLGTVSFNFTSGTSSLKWDHPVSGRTRRRRHSLTLSWRRLIPKPRIQTFSTLLACRFRNRLRHP